MAEFQPKGKKQKQETPVVFNTWRKVREKPVPDTFKIGRQVTFQLAKVERDLFSDVEEKESGNYIISGLPRKITQTDFEAFSFGIAQILYNQSFQSGNTDTNSGLSKKQAVKITRETGQTRYSGEVIFTLNELCRIVDGGELITDTKKAMKALIHTCDSTPVEIKFENGNYQKRYLSKIMGEDYIDGALTYWLHLNPIFCENVKRNFAEFPQDLSKRLTAATKKRKAEHYRLIRLLGRQDKRSPFVRRMDQLLTDLDLTEAYKNERGKTEQKILSLLNDLKKKEMGLILDYETETAIIRRKERITKVIFHLNPYFTRKRKANEKE